MNNIHVFTNSGSMNHRIFNGKSTDGLVGSYKIDKINVKNRDELISKAILNSDHNSYILCAYGPLLTNMKTVEIYDTLEWVMKEINFDVLYLTLYANECRLDSDERSYGNMVFKRTISPHGTECILISPNGVNRIIEYIHGKDGRGYDFYLNSAAEKMLLYTSYPPMMMVDLSKRSDDIKLIKGSVCREVITSKEPLDLTKKYTGNMNLFWFFLIVVFILFIAAMLLSFDSSLTNGSVNGNGNGNGNGNFKGNEKEIYQNENIGKQKAAELLTAYPSYP